MKAIPKVTFSHVGIYVHDLARMELFYTTMLGLLVTDRGILPGRELVFMTLDANEHHQLVLASGRDAENNIKVLNQLSFKVKSLRELRVFYESLQATSDVSDLTPINHGLAWSLYFRDPEGNRVEVFLDSPWYVEQPISDPLDLSLSDGEILTNTEQTYQGRPGFQLRTEWQETLKHRLNTN